MGLRPIQLGVKLFVPVHGEVSQPELERSRLAITWLLTGLVAVNRDFRQLYPAVPSLYASDVLYKLEDKTEIWQDVPTTLARGCGDCEDLAAYRCADLQLSGVAALPYVTWRQIGTRTIYHCLVRHPDGLIEDPSRALGMNGHPVVRCPVFIEVDPP